MTWGSRKLAGKTFSDFLNLAVSAKTWAIKKLPNRKMRKSLGICTPEVGDLESINQVFLRSLIPSQSITLHNPSSTSLLLLTPPKDKLGWSSGRLTANYELITHSILSNLITAITLPFYTFLQFIFFILSDLVPLVLQDSQVRQKHPKTVSWG